MRAAAIRRFVRAGGQHHLLRFHGDDPDFLDVGSDHIFDLVAFLGIDQGLPETGNSGSVTGTARTVGSQPPPTSCRPGSSQPHRTASEAGLGSSGGQRPRTGMASVRPSVTLQEILEFAQSDPMLARYAMAFIEGDVI